MLFIGQRPAPRPSRVGPHFSFRQGIAHVVDTADTFQIQLDSFVRLRIEQTGCTAPEELTHIPI